jgi:ABC-2 type transport system permease protein
MLTLLTAAMRKELLLLLRDREALLLLLAMPLVFVLIMSLALQDTFGEHGGAKLAMVVVNEDAGKVGEKLAENFANDRHFRVELRTTAERTRLQEELRRGQFKFALWIPPQTTEQAVRRIQQQLNLAPASDAQAPVTLQLLADPAVRTEQRAIVMNAVNRALQTAESAILLQQLNEAGKRLTRARQLFPEIPAVRAPATLTTFTEITEIATERAARRMPTSVQQNAPSWTLLSMFFLVVPLSFTLIKERQQGSLMRLQSLATPPALLLVGKLIPYFVINQMQMLLILLEGMYLLPLLGGEALTIGDSPGGIALVSAGASLAAIGFGLLVAVYLRTPEQANVFGPIVVLILAAVGGILVPKIVMPPFMQQLGNISPLSWALDGFHDIFLRGGGVVEVLPEFLRLTAFGAVCFGIAAFRFRRYFRT